MSYIDISVILALEVKGNRFSQIRSDLVESLTLGHDRQVGAFRNVLSVTSVDSRLNRPFHSFDLILLV